MCLDLNKNVFQSVLVMCAESNKMTRTHQNKIDGELLNGCHNSSTHPQKIITILCNFPHDRNTFYPHFINRITSMQTLHASTRMLQTIQQYGRVFIHAIRVACLFMNAYSARPELHSGNNRRIMNESKSCTL